MKFDIKENEYWWGGLICLAEKMPFDSKTVIKIDLLCDKRTQSAPLFLSNKGRYIWSEEPYIISFNKGEVEINSDFPVYLEEGGKTLRDAYISAKNKYFPFEENIHTPREYYKYPQFNTWMELIKNQNQDDIIKYAEEIIENGYKPGILTIDGGWQKCQGTWEFNRELVYDAKAMVDRLHELGFLVMIWVSPFVCPEGETFLELYSTRSSEAIVGKKNMNHLLRTADGDVAIQHWWSGYGAIFNFNLPDDCEFMDKQLRHLLDDYGFDGFKFDGGAYKPETFINGTDFYGGYSFSELNIAWVNFGAKYKYHEFKDIWKQCGKPVMQRLFDKSHSWDGNGINCLIPHGCFAGLIGCPFICPDMVGGGEWTAFVYGKRDEELFVRMAQCSALFPMMQFSSLPWRHLSKKAQKLCRDMAQLHEDMYPEIEKIVANTEKTGEPIIRSMEYQFPGCGYENINSQFMLGDEILVAPVITKGETVKKVYIPDGKWQNCNDGIIYEGRSVIEVDAPIECLPWFRLIK